MSSVPQIDANKPEDSGETDATLVRDLQATGDMRYMEKIWQRHGRAVYARALRTLRNQTDAEDITAETFLRAHRAILSGLYQDNSLVAWLNTIAKNLAINLVAKLQNTHRAETGELIQIECAKASPETAAEVESVLNQLSDKQRITLKFLYYHELTYKDIATKLGWSVDEVKTHAQNGRRMFERIWCGRPHPTRSVR